MDLTVSRVACLRGVLRPASDKSLTHRAYLLAASASSDSVVREPLRSQDCQNTLQAISQLGAKSASIVPEQIRIRPAAEWSSPGDPVDCGNSGTTMRLLSGLIASRPIEAVLTGDESLSKRPMSRIAEPLRQMGAEIKGDFAPLHIVGGALKGIEHRSSVASAQVKSCLLLAGARAQGETWVIEPSLSRDHTERLLDALGVNLLHRAETEGNVVGIRGGSRWPGFEFTVPADISSAAFPLVAASLLPGSNITLLDVGINPTRTGILDALASAGIRVAVSHERQELGEPLADLTLHSDGPKTAFAISGSMVPRLVDEVPALAILATQCDGVSRFTDIGELRVKESNRISAVANGLRAMGAKVESGEDFLEISGPTPLQGATVDSLGDHRIAMAFAIAGLAADGKTTIRGAESITTSYPGFERDIWGLCVL